MRRTSISTMQGYPILLLLAVFLTLTSGSMVRADMPADGELTLIVDSVNHTMTVVGNNASGVSGLQITSLAGGLMDTVSSPGLLDFVISSQKQFYAEGSFSGRTLDGPADLSSVYDFQLGLQDLEFKYSEIESTLENTGSIQYVIPEPSTAVLLLMGSFAWNLRRRR